MIHVRFLSGSLSVNCPAAVRFLSRCKFVIASLPGLICHVSFPHAHAEEKKYHAIADPVCGNGADCNRGAGV